MDPKPSLPPKKSAIVFFNNAASLLEFENFHSTIFGNKRYNKFLMQFRCSCVVFLEDWQKVVRKNLIVILAKYIFSPQYETVEKISGSFFFLWRRWKSNNSYWKWEDAKVSKIRFFWLFRKILDVLSFRSLIVILENWNFSDDYLKVEELKKHFFVW